MSGDVLVIAGALLFAVWALATWELRTTTEKRMPRRPGQADGASTHKGKVAQ